MRAYPLFSLIVLAACGEPAKYSISTEKFYHDDTIRLDRSDKTDVSAGDRAVLVGGWDISQDEYDRLILSRVHLRVLAWYKDKGWKHPADYDVEAVDPRCADREAGDERCVLPRPELTVFQQTFELCWFESEGVRRRISPGFTFDTDGHVDVWGLLAPYVNRGSSMSLDLFCDIGDHAPKMTFAVVPMWIEGSGLGNRRPSDSVTFYTLDDEAQQAVVYVGEYVSGGTPVF